MSDALREKTLEARQVFQGRVISVFCDRVLLPDGTEATREVVKHPGAVVVAALTPARELLLVRQFRYPTGEVLLELPAGKLDAGEPPLACAARELAEETGYRAGKMKLLFSFYTTPGFSDEVLHFVLAEDLAPGPPASEWEEFVEVVTMPLEEALAKVFAGEIRDAKTILGIFALALREAGRIAF